MGTLSDYSNPFVALGVEVRELSYSKAIANVLFRDSTYLEALSRRLGLALPLRFRSDEIHTEVPFGSGQRLDILAHDEQGRHVIVETKVCMPIDLAQQAKYVATAKEKWPEEEVIFLAFKLGPVRDREHLPDFHLLTSKETLEDLPPGDHLGLREMLELFSAMEDRIEQDPVGALEGVEPIDKAIRGLFAEPLYRRLFKTFCDQVLGQLVGDPQVNGFEVTARGGKIAQIFDWSWQSTEFGTQVHFEVKDNQRLALHFETFPYPSKEAHKIAMKGVLVKMLQRGLASAAIDGLDLVNPRLNSLVASSTTIATVKIDFQDLEGSTMQFVQVYNDCHSLITEVFANQAQGGTSH